MVGSTIVGAAGWLMAAGGLHSGTIAGSVIVVAAGIASVQRFLLRGQLREAARSSETSPWRHSLPAMIFVALGISASIAAIRLQPFDREFFPGGLDLVDLFSQMGPVALSVFGILFLMSLWSLGVAIERIYTFNQARKQSKLFALQVAKHLKDGRLKEAIALSSSKDFRYSHLAKVVLAGLQEYQFQQETSPDLNRDEVQDAVRRAIQRATAATASDLKRGVGTLATIGSTAPFVGLLGTVVGVVNAFVGIASTGAGGIAAISAGISEALIETAMGLFVAIPAVWFYNYLTSRIEYFNVEMTDSSSAVFDYFIRKAT
jgi:biopolymer transport protein ExbB/biopolymer transport protein TolQ